MELPDSRMSSRRCAKSVNMLPRTTARHPKVEGRIRRSSVFHAMARAGIGLTLLGRLASESPVLYTAYFLRTNSHNAEAPLFSVTFSDH